MLCFSNAALNVAVAQLLTGIIFGGEDNISIILCILLFGMPVTTDALLPSLLHLKLLLVCIRAAKLCWSTAGAQPDALAADLSLNQCPAGRHTITVVCVRQSECRSPCEADSFSSASFARLANKLLLVSLRAVGSASWQLAGQSLPWACASFARRPL